MIISVVFLLPILDIIHNNSISRDLINTNTIMSVDKWDIYYIYN